MDNTIDINCSQQCVSNIFYCKMATFVLMLLKMLTSNFTYHQNVADANLCQNSGSMILILHYYCSIPEYHIKCTSF